MKTAFNRAKGGFTLIELLVVMGIIMILASMLLPAIARAKGTAYRIKCLSNNKQVQLAAQMFVDDNDDLYPARRSGIENWVATLKPYYINPKVLQCPSDNFLSDRSMIINGFNDYFEKNLSAADYTRYKNWAYPTGMPAHGIPDPSQTITFGEKDKGSFHVHMDFYQGAGNDMEEIEHDRHRMGKEKTGGSNFSFADGSARYLKYGKSINPINLWAVTEEWRGVAVTPD